jgi:glycosyltransferase involved in cell wall biosynthesis
MSRYVLYTQAYNAERTLARTIECVLGQTSGDIIYYILDNASTDGTAAVIRAYAAKDARIIHLTNENNSIWVEEGGCFSFFRKHDDDCYFGLIDADDEYEKNFLERTTSFLEANRLDVAACGSDYIDAQTGRLCGSRELDKDLLIEGEGFSTLFTVYHQFTRTIWGKLFSLPTVRKGWETCRKTGMVYGFDTFFVQHALRHSNRFGILAEKLHTYYIFPKSASYVFDPIRVASDRILFESAKDFLIAKIGSVTPENEYFLYSVYINAVQDTLKVLMTAQMSDHEKLSHVAQIKLELAEIQEYFATHPKPMQS